MRKLQLKKVYLQHGVEAESEVVEIEATDKKRLLIFVIRSDDVDVEDIRKVKEGLTGVLAGIAPNTKGVVLALDPDAHLEVYEEEES